jgi:dihydrolipoamide dehydrogenase
VKEIRQVGDSLSVVWGSSDGERSAQANIVLMATGRRPFTAGLGIADLDIKMNGDSIGVDEYLETSAKGIYAIGDVLGTNMLAHVASHEGIAAVDNALGRKRKVNYHAVPTCVFTSPPVACVGISEADAREHEIPYVVSKFPFTACARATANGDTTGLVKLICRENDLEVLGMHIMGRGADDLIAEGTLAMQVGATAEDLAYTLHIHPSLSEAIHEAAMGQLNGSIHFGRIKDDR